MSALSDIEVYDNRMSRAWCELDARWFDALNAGASDGLTLMGGGCLDAPEQLPAGSIRSYGKTSPIVRQSVVSRPDRAPDAATAAAQSELANRLIAAMTEAGRADRRLSI